MTTVGAKWLFLTLRGVYGGPEVAILTLGDGHGGPEVSIST